MSSVPVYRLSFSCGSASAGQRETVTNTRRASSRRREERSMVVTPVRRDGIAAGGDALQRVQCTLSGYGWGKQKLIYDLPSTKATTQQPRTCSPPLRQ